MISSISQSNPIRQTTSRSTHPAPTTPSQSADPQDSTQLSEEAHEALNPSVPLTLAGRGISTGNFVDKAFGGGGLPAGLRSGGGILAAAGGGYELEQGISELTHGDTGKGATDAAEGGGNALGGVLLAAGSKAAPIAFAASSAVGGTEQLVGGIEHGNTGDVVEGGVKDLGAGLLTAGTLADATGIGAVAGVPLQAAGGLILAGTTIYDNAGAIGHALGSAASTVGHTASSAARSVGHFFSSLF